MSATVNFVEESGAAEAYETAIAMIESAGAEVEREAHEAVGQPYELAVVKGEAGTFGLTDLRIIGPLGHAGFDPDERVTTTPEARVALRVIQGGVTA